MNREDRKLIQTWTENELDSGDEFDSSHVLLISIKRSIWQKQEAKETFKKMTWRSLNEHS